MPTVASIMTELKSKGSEKTRVIYARHGMSPERVFGVSIADLKVIAKTIKGQQAIACGLYQTGIMDAMYLAGLVADGSKLTPKDLNEWAEAAAGLPMISEYTVPWVTVENSCARELAVKWIKSKKEHMASSGWCTYSGLVTIRSDDELDLEEIQSLLGRVVKESGTAPNRVRQSMNAFVIAVGSYVKPLLKQAKEAVPQAAIQIEKMEASGKLGQKRKTIRC
jgi:hypothetical protein